MVIGKNKRFLSYSPLMNSDITKRKCELGSGEKGSTHMGCPSMVQVTLYVIYAEMNQFRFKLLMNFF